MLNILERILANGWREVFIADRAKWVFYKRHWHCVVILATEQVIFTNIRGIMY